MREDRAKAPKLPSFVDGKDDLDAYLQRFERFATTAKWEKTGWASKLSALLSGRALEVYSRLSEEAAQDYDRVKLALMKRYDLTEDGYRRKFRASKPEVDDSPEQFKVRLDRYLLRWLERSILRSTRKASVQLPEQGWRKQRVHGVTQQPSSVTSVMPVDTKLLTAQL